MSDPWVSVGDIPDIPDMSWAELPAEDSWQPINLATLEERPPVQPTLGGVGICYPGKRHVFSGPQESAKTLAAYMVALEVGRTGGTAIIIDLEMGQWDARDRLRELGATTDDLGAIHYIEPHQPATTERIASLVRLAAQLVIIDAAAGAYDLQSLDDNKRGDVERFTSLYVQHFWRAGTATLVLDHVVKNADSRGTYAIGSERKVGGADVHLGFEAITPIRRGGDGIYKITTHKDRGGYLQRGRLADLHLASDPDTNEITWEFRAPIPTDEAGDAHHTIYMERVSRALEEAAAPLTLRQLFDAVKGKDEYKKLGAGELVRDGFCTEQDGPRNARIFTLIKPYRPTENDRGPTAAPPRPAAVIEPRPDRGPPLKGDAATGRGHTPQSEPPTAARPPGMNGQRELDPDIPF